MREGPTVSTQRKPEPGGANYKSVTKNLGAEPGKAELAMAGHGGGW